HARAEALDDPLAGAPAQVALAPRKDEMDLARPAQVELAAVAVGDRGGRARREGDLVQGLALEGAGDLQVGAGDLEGEAGDRRLEADQVARLDRPQVGGGRREVDGHLRG